MSAAPACSSQHSHRTRVCFRSASRLPRALLSYLHHPSTWQENQPSPSFAPACPTPPMPPRRRNTTGPRRPDISAPGPIPCPGGPYGTGNGTGARPLRGGGRRRDRRCDATMLYHLDSRHPPPTSQPMPPSLAPAPIPRHPFRIGTGAWRTHLGQGSRRWPCPVTRHEFGGLPPGPARQTSPASLQKLAAQLPIRWLGNEPHMLDEQQRPFQIVGFVEPDLDRHPLTATEPGSGRTRAPVQGNGAPPSGILPGPVYERPQPRLQEVSDPVHPLPFGQGHERDGLGRHEDPTRLDLGTTRIRPADPAAPPALLAPPPGPAAPSPPVSPIAPPGPGAG